MDGGESKKGASNKVLIGVLCGLLVLIVGLGVGVVVVAINNNTDDTEDQGEEEEEIAWDCSQLDDGDRDMVLYCLGREANSYYEAGDCVKALKVYDDISEDRFDKSIWASLYNEAYSISLSCDESLQEYWENKHYELVIQVKGKS